MANFFIQKYKKNSSKLIYQAMLNGEFIKWVALAFAVATPVAWYILNKWLESFAYKTSLSWWIFAVADSLLNLQGLKNQNSLALRYE